MSTEAKEPAPICTSTLLIKLKRHVKACPIGWHRGQVKLHRATVDADVISWIQELERIVGIQQEVTATRTRLPRPYTLDPTAGADDPIETICTWPIDGRAPGMQALMCNRTDCPHCQARK